MTNIQNESFAIANPYVKFAICKEAFDNFAQIYNSGKDLNLQLRSHHHELFYKIVRFYNSQLSKDKVLFKGGTFIDFRSDTTPVLRTNNLMLSKELKRNKATIYRQLLRLIESGVIIKKIHHGTKNNFELLINPEILLIFDLEAPKYVPFSKFTTSLKQTDNQRKELILNNQSIANCNHNQNRLETLNNKIIKLKGIPNTRDVLNETTEKVAGSTEASKQIINTEKGYSARLLTTNEQFSSLKSKYSKLLLHVALESIWKDSTIFDLEKEKALQYISSNYFENCQTANSLLKQFSEFKWRIEAAGRYLKRKEDFEMHIFPVRYFDLNNPKGFRGTKKWYLNYLFRLDKRVKQHKVLSEDEKLAKILRIYSNTPNYATYKTCLAYIQDNIPLKINQFNQAIAPIFA